MAAVLDKAKVSSLFHHSVVSLKLLQSRKPDPARITFSIKAICAGVVGLGVGGGGSPCFPIVVQSRHPWLSLVCKITLFYDLLLIEQFIPSCTDGKLTPALGLVVGLRRCRYSKDDTNPLPFVVVGQCACEPLQTPLADLVRFSLPSPDWTATREKVARHFPGGCEECGVWVRMVEGCSRERVQELMDVLQEKTDLQVCATFHADLQP